MAATRMRPANQSGGTNTKDVVYPRRCAQPGRDLGSRANTIGPATGADGVVRLGVLLGLLGVASRRGRRRGQPPSRPGVVLLVAERSGSFGGVAVPAVRARILSAGGVARRARRATAAAPRSASRPDVGGPARPAAAGQPGQPRSSGHRPERGVGARHQDDPGHGPGPLADCPTWAPAASIPGRRSGRPRWWPTGWG